MKLKIIRYRDKFIIQRGYIFKAYFAEGLGYSSNAWYHTPDCASKFVSIEEAETYAKNYLAKVVTPALKVEKEIYI